MAPKQERRKRGRWEQYNADFNADENSQSQSSFSDRQGNSNDKDSGNAAGLFIVFSTRKFLIFVNNCSFIGSFLYYFI